MNQNSATTTLRALDLIMLWLMLITLSMLFLPVEEFSRSFALKIEANRFYLYVALIVEGSHFLSRAFIAISTRLYAARRMRREAEEMHNAVTLLDFAEKALLREFVLQRRSVLDLPLNEPSVRSLMDSGLITLSAADSGDSERGMFVISRAARPFITYRAIGLSRSRMTEEQINEIMRSRPAFARAEVPMPRAYRTHAHFQNSQARAA